MVGSKYRPYIQPPYKYQTTNYERRMKRIRRFTLHRALHVSNQVRASTFDQDELEGIMQELHQPDTLDKFAWIEATVAEMERQVEPLNYNGLTRARVRRLKDISQGFLDVLHNEQRRRSRCSTTVGRLSIDREGAVDEPDRLKDLLHAKACYADLLESIALPFWPRKKTVATKERKSIYNQEVAEKERKKKGIKLVTKIRRRRSRRSTQMRKSQTRSSRPLISPRDENAATPEKLPDDAMERQKVSPLPSPSSHVHVAASKHHIPTTPSQTPSKLELVTKAASSVPSIDPTESDPSDPHKKLPRFKQETVASQAKLDAKEAERQRLLTHLQEAAVTVAPLKSHKSAHGNKESTHSLEKSHSTAALLNPRTSDQQLLLEGKRTTDSIVALAESQIMSDAEIDASLGNKEHTDLLENHHSTAALINPRPSDQQLLLEGKRTTDSIVDMAESRIMSDPDMDVSLRIGVNRPTPSGPNASQNEISWRYGGH
ncbi:uncharacterized protein LOC129600464 isoform X2 [Paramacrobiotus metropolitanus]|uniref:uncharacterized protein LOC129600464 isoform X2 n=1 Tax=Paramacrobiotus metropolitanus TaxID=2943436 RepID=UPI002445F2EC|nr:uncharacterized protein LOC129600464 isoform X2 [Paramacrobiotus metropolitanus]